MITAKRLLFVAGLPAAAALLTASTAYAQQSPNTGQPGTSNGVNCVTTAPAEPGQASSSTGSPFNEPSGNNLGGTAGMNYAGSGSGSAHAQSTAAVSQYDIACGQLSSH